ncbi:ImmA/IrrE family metallo-endopeptidase [Myxococcus sp. K15C18031901]|uniref:ImmA/IrrE family metallo-endopeptidase n=1 Tax=Myxococcus dinghuensis TaxID=2906761 RepID=UPI0020A7B5F9|nr:ImmA/IrrE family metallo-endopeptidase [Myxococcus dinghuensis]MCP3105584.1 ImmA/IrrE family metallo-endopeptidase [Myxococcus dinghuensis]
MSTPTLDLSWRTLRATPALPVDVLARANITSVPVDAIQLLVALGVKVYLDDLPVPGILQFDDELASVFLNKEDGPSRQQFTAAMMLGLLLSVEPGDHARTSGPPQTMAERKALEFASGLLMPNWAVLESLKSQPSLSIAERAKRFGVSMAAMEVCLGRQVTQEAKLLAAIGLSATGSATEDDAALQKLLDGYKAERFTGLPPDVVAFAAQRYQLIADTWAAVKLHRAFGLPELNGAIRLAATVEDVRDVLTEAKRLLLKGGWCRGKGFLALDAYGKRVAFAGERAYQFSVVGAIRRADVGDVGAGLVAEAVVAKLVGHHYKYLTEWNDKTTATFEEVLATFDQAIALATPAEQ